MKTPEQMAEEYCEDHDECEFARDAFIAGYKAAMDQLADVSKVMPQWISVSDRLPEEGHHAVVRINDGEYHVAWRENGCWFMYNPCCVYNSQLKDVTHWMPLPSAPKEEK